ncbi:amino acid adenylation domain-containing protein [Paenibacillus beijingensis]|uniref:Carrier domain-containing protein n=1 Tax=Paenibacillus beijingensis TaxID=1126833 RepID=A0A0D5NDL0_9BACL|nr:amino acid adenylation domain-containing protein [Paenibacillus beijingensis]AJY73316.1 hypothetical protein VN24_00075 [Paenibacillus beijingensis]
MTIPMSKKSNKILEETVPNTLHQLFMEQVKLTPDNIAIQYEGTPLTYSELDQKSNILAHKLKHCGVGPECVVGLMSYRSLDMITGILAILKAGGAYLPLDPDYPQDRLSYLVSDSQARIILCQRGLEQKFFQSDISFMFLDEQVSYKESQPQEKHEDIYSQSNNLAYIIYTSGSTGTPKGVMIEHKAIVNTITWRKNFYKMSSSDVVLQLPSISFDSSVEDIFTTLLSGAKLLLISQNQRLNIKYLQKLISDEKVSHFLSVPSFYQELLGEKFDLLSNMRFITIAGEDFTPHLVEEHYLKLPNVLLYNEYGPTENSVCSTCYFFDRDKEIKLVSIGKPIDNTNVYILDANFNQVKNGEVGEIFLAGTGLARGYLNNPKLTNERFILNPNGDGQRLYRTGDLAMQLHDGNIKYLGREDDQVKIRGFRIELKEIEYQLLKSGLVKNAFVTMKTDASRNKQLIAYVVADQIQSDALILMLRSTFPEYMIPNKFVYLDAVPLTPNGKVNAQALPDPFVSYQPVKDPTANVIQKKLEVILSNITSSAIDLNENNINRDIKYFGVDSLSFIKLLVEIELNFGFEFDYEDLVSSTITVSDLLSVIESNIAGD